MVHIIRSSFKPLYLQISDSFRDDIESGKLSPGDQIWSERKIMETFNVSRNTAQQAIEELVHSGMVTRIQGKGTFVAERKVSYGLQRLTSFSEEMRMKGMTPSSRLLSLSKENPSPSVAKWLNMSSEDRVYRMERLRLADQLPMAYQISYIPEGICPDLDRYDFSKESLFSVIENQYNLRLSWQHQVIKPVIASKTEAQLLEIKIGMPLLLAEGVAFLEDGTPVEAKRILYRSDLYEFTVRSSRKQDSLF